MGSILVDVLKLFVQIPSGTRSEIRSLGDLPLCP
ncbi:hypothetical protein ACP70R_009265 [Stipagrostis hirtigluma subsp. patula]